MIRTLVFTTALSTTLTVSMAAVASPTHQDRASVIMDRVMVVGNKDNISDITGSAYVVDEEELEKFHYTDINRVLAKVPGVNIQEEEGYGNRPNIGIRGGRSERSADITLMEDGVLIAPAPYAAPSAYYFPRVGRMESVEVRKGSSSIKFGPQTTSGAVNLISKSIPNQRKFEATGIYGEDSTYKSNVTFGDAVDNVGFLVDIGHESTDGFKSISKVGGDTGYSIQDGIAKLRFSTDETSDIYQSIEFKVGFTEEDSDETYLGLTEADFAANPFQRYAASQLDNMDAEHKQFMMRHYIEPVEDWDITTTVYRNEFKRNWYKVQDITVGGDDLGGSLSAALDSAAHLAALKGDTDLDGSDANHIALRANNRKYFSQGIQTQLAGSFTTGDIEHETEFGIRYHYDEEDRYQHEDKYSIINGVLNLTSAGAAGSNADRVGSATALAIHMLDDMTIGRWHVSPGLRVESVELKRDDTKSGTIIKNDITAFIPGIGIGYDVSEQLNAFVGVHKGFAPPAPGSTGPVDEEESINYELGMRYTQDALFAELIGFFTDYDNLLGDDTISSGGLGTGDAFNGGEVEVYGVEFNTTYDMAEQFNARDDLRFPVSFNYTYTQAEFKSSFNDGAAVWGVVTAGDELPYVPEHQFYTSIGVENDVWGVHVSGKYIDQMRTQAGSGPIPAGQGTDSRFIIDASANYQVHENANAFVTITNLTDEEYVAARRPAGARPGAPQTILVGMKVSF